MASLKHGTYSLNRVVITILTGHNGLMKEIIMTVMVSPLVAIAVMAGIVARGNR